MQLTCYRPGRALSLTVCVLATVLLLLSSIRLQAEPADWYQWQSRLTGKLICKQTDPGAGWQQHDGPFLDAGCRQRKSPAARPG